MLRTMSCVLIVMSVGFGQIPASNREGNLRLAPRMLNYQGYLTDTLGNPININSLSMNLIIYDQETGGNALWTELQSPTVEKGIFHVLLGSDTPIPDSVFTKSPNRWLEIQVGLTALTPRTRIVSSAYAVASTYADTAIYVKNGSSDNDWLRSGGKVYTFNLTDSVGIRTTSPRYSLDVNGVVCAGALDTVLAAYGAILGGYRNLAGDAASDTGAVVAGGVDNAAIGKWSTVGGGRADTASYAGTTVAGGVHNVASSNMYSTVGGGVGNTASGYSSVVAGGYYNRASIGSSAVAGGSENSAGEEGSTVGGGWLDTTKGWWCGVFSGCDNLAGDASGDSAAVVAGGYKNSALAMFSSVGGGQLNTASGDFSTVAGGRGDTASIYGSTVAGGFHNVARSNYYSTVGGGVGNLVTGYSGTVAGGFYNTVVSGFSTVAGGAQNYNAASFSAILGGSADTITSSGNYSYLFGINSNLTQDSTFMVDLPHIRFGKEASGYEFPASDGSAGQALVTNGAGQVGWGSPADNDWTRSGGKIYTSNLTDTVGVRTASPQYALDVNGDLRADRLLYNSARPHIVSIGSEGFLPTSDLPYVNGSGNGGAYLDTAITGSLHATLNLPNNATITEFKIYFYDNSSSNISVYLDRQFLGGAGYGILATITTSGASATYRADSTATIANPVVNNESFGYMINAYCAPWPGSSDLRIKGAVITYTIPEAD